MRRSPISRRRPRQTATNKRQGIQLTEKYYIRPRKEENAKKWQGPFDTTKLKELADRRLFSKELHEYSEDRLNWISARQIWPTLFPKSAKSVLTSSQSLPVAAAATANPATQATGSGDPQLKPNAVSPAVEETQEWYCSSEGAQQGPFTFSQLRKFVSEGRVLAADLVWCPQFGEQWVEAQTVPELFQPTEPSFKLLATNAAAKIPPMALASFILGLLGTSLLLGVGSLLAVIFGHIALSEFNRPQSSKNGKWMAIAGLSLGYAIIAILLIAMVVYLAITLAKTPS